MSSIMPRSTAQALVGALLAFLQVIAGAAALSELTSPMVYGWIIVGVAAFQAGWAYYMQTATTPAVDVAAVSTDEGTVAGPAADHPTGTPVDVVEAVS